MISGWARFAPAVLIELSLLALAFIIGRALEKIRFRWLDSSGVALILGLVTGLIFRGAHLGHDLTEAVSFKGGVFFYILLPVICFDAGYGLDMKLFVRNVGACCSFAFVGTTISVFTVGLMMWGFGLAGWCIPLTLLQCLTFGTVISATDTVAVLSVFQRLNAQKDLYIAVLGESLLNDAVALVLFEVIAQFTAGDKLVNAKTVLSGVGIFFGVCLGSAVIGIALGLLAALIFRSKYFYSTAAEAELLEVGVAFVFAYGSYLVADVAHCSGIVAVVVNGMVMNMYVRPNMTKTAAHRIEALFHVLAGLFELFVFIYTGISVFLTPHKVDILPFSALCLVALAASRALNIFPLSAIVNLLRPPERHIPFKQQFVIWWSGLRGAMAFALAIVAAEEFGEAGEVMKTCTIYMVFVTVLFNGGTLSFIMEKLHLRAYDDPGPSDSSYAPGLPQIDKFDSKPDMLPAAMLGAESTSSLYTDNTDHDAVGGSSLAAASEPIGIGRSIGRGSRDPIFAGNLSTLSEPLAKHSRRSRSLWNERTILNRVRAINDGRLVFHFERLDSRLSKLFLHPEARQDRQQQQSAQQMAALATSSTLSIYKPPALSLDEPPAVAADRYPNASSGGGGPADSSEITIAPGGDSSLQPSSSRGGSAVWPGGTRVAPARMASVHHPTGWAVDGVGGRSLITASRKFGALDTLSVRQASEPSPGAAPGLGLSRRSKDLTVQDHVDDHV